MVYVHGFMWKMMPHSKRKSLSLVGSSPEKVVRALTLPSLGRCGVGTGAGAGAGVGWSAWSRGIRLKMSAWLLAQRIGSIPVGAGGNTGAGTKVEGGGGPGGGEKQVSRMEGCERG